MADSERVDAQFDVVIAGGGLVGATAALLLAKTGLSIALLDRAVPRERRGALGYDMRTVALNPASMSLLDEIGVFSTLRAPTLTRQPFAKMVVWEERGTRHIEFSAREVARRELGWIVEVSPTVEALWRALADESSVTCYTGAQITAVAPGEDAVDVGFGERSFRARLLLAADGGESAVRRLSGVRIDRFETGHCAIATVVETERCHDETAWQRFLQEGPVALLPLPDREGRHFCSVVWSQPASSAAARMAASDEEFARELEAATERRLGRIQAVDLRYSFVLEQLLAEQFQPSPRVLLVGDAARVLHPLAGQGVNLGFEDIAGVRDAVDRTGSAGLGDTGIWRAHARRRRIRGEIMVRAMDAFRRVYTIDDPGLSWLRNVAVDFVNQTPVLKTLLMREALGLRS